MNREIFVSGDRILKLNNLFALTIDLSTLKEKDSLDKKIRLFENYIKNNNLIKVGPFVIKTVLVGIDEPKIILTLLQKIKNEEFKPIPPYEIIKELNSGLCVYSRFEGHESNVNLAQSKMQVYAYENYLILDNTSYTVYVNREENGDCVIDTFTAIIGREKNQYERI